MNYYFYNTDAASITGPPRPRFCILIDEGFAAAGGDKQRFGEQFRQLEKDDILLMYENGTGVVAVGRVLEPWDGKPHSFPRYYTTAEMRNLTGGPHEYRIKVEWFLDRSANPVTLGALRHRFHSTGFTPRRTVRRIIKYRHEIQAMLDEVGSGAPEQSVDPAVSLPERIESTAYRILRDTTKAVYVKELHNFRCQVCGRTIRLANGKRYAEAHHIRPLGKPHNGPDVVGNILCVCPNHHAELDFVAAAIAISSLRLPRTPREHKLNPEYIEYHNRRWQQTRKDKCGR
jgi:HNH endonuclease